MDAVLKTWPKSFHSFPDGFPIHTSEQRAGILTLVSADSFPPLYTLFTKLDQSIEVSALDSHMDMIRWCARKSRFFLSVSYRRDGRMPSSGVGQGSRPMIPFCSLVASHLTVRKCHLVVWVWVPSIRLWPWASHLTMRKKVNVRSAVTSSGVQAFWFKGRHRARKITPGGAIICAP
jgi:hypothetical protein